MDPGRSLTLGQPPLTPPHDFLLNESRWIASDQTGWWYVTSYYRSAGDNGPIADCDSFQDRGSRPDPNVIADCDRRDVVRTIKLVEVGIENLDIPSDRAIRSNRDALAAMQLCSLLDVGSRADRDPSIVSFPEHGNVVPQRHLVAKYDPTAGRRRT
jgi:hypothetical protein